MDGPVIAPEGYVSGPARCRVCSHEWTAVIPADCDEDSNLECPDCPSASGDIQTLFDENLERPRRETSKQIKYHDHGRLFVDDET